MSRTRVVVVGANGRMGKAIAAAARDSSDLAIVGIVRGEPIEEAISNCQVVIDFSHADATERNCAECVAQEKPIVIGTTGQSREQIAAIDDAAKSVPVLLAANFSVGVNTLFWLTRKAAELLGPDFDIEIVETHHRLKKDAPSGTAKRLLQILSEARNLDARNHVAHGREGMIGERPKNEIGVHAIRAGDVVGEHTVMFAAKGERLELMHKASSRETFAIGALRAARWIVGKPAGLYDMEDVLGL